MEIKLREYQQSAINATREKIKEGKKRFVLCAPTGSGKTVTFSFIVKNAVAKGSRVLILTHRTELLTQAGGSLASIGIDPGKIEAGKKISYFNNQVYTAMIETINRRMNKLEYINFIQSLDLIIIDECHFGNFDKFFSQIKKETVVIGFTATPYRDKNQKSLDEMYEDLIEVISIPELIEQGFLSDPYSYGVPVDLSEVGTKAGDYDFDQMGKIFSEKKLWHGVIENYKKHSNSRKAIAFTPNVASSIELRDEMIRSGLNAKHIDGNTPKKERKEILDWFKKTTGAIICNCSILTTGFDEPSIETVILYRATKSLPLFLQMCGRGSRVIPGIKSTFQILDFGNNFDEHGMWEDNRHWSLKKKKKKEGAPPMKECPSCEALNYASVMTCKHCGHEFERNEKEEKEREYAELKMLPKKERLKKAIRSSLQEKAEMAKKKLISPYWVLHQIKEKDEAKEFCRLMGYKPGFIHFNKDRFKCLQNE